MAIAEALHRWYTIIYTGVVTCQILKFWSVIRHAQTKHTQFW